MCLYCSKLARQYGTCFLGCGPHCPMILVFYVGEVVTTMFGQLAQSGIFEILCALYRCFSNIQKTFQRI